MVQLAITARNTKEKPADVRASGMVPAVLYGHKEPATAISLNAGVFKKVWRDSGETTILTLEGVGEPKDALIHEVAVHPLTGEPEHVDFYVLEKGKKISLPIPVEFVGVSGAEKVGGITVKVLHEIEIEVEPKELPQYLEVDISSLQNIGDHIAVKQVKIPASATFVTDPEEIVVSITEQKIVEEMPTTPPTDEELAAAEGKEGAADGDAEASKEE